MADVLSKKQKKKAALAAENDAATNAAPSKKESKNNGAAAASQKSSTKAAASSSDAISHSNGVVAAAAAAGANSAPTNGFAALGLVPELLEACERIGWRSPTPIQIEAIPFALQKRDIIALAQTGSGKTGAFAIPVLNALIQNPKPFFAVVISPTRELALQIVEQFEALGAGVGVRCVSIIGGFDEVTQMRLLAKKPHVIVATPGRLLHHLQATKGFSLRDVQFLILDEADRLLNDEFEKEVDMLLEALPQSRQTFLFSATMTSKVKKLQRASLKNPVRLEIANKYQTVETLKQQYILCPHQHKDVYFVHMLNELVGSTIIVFVCTCSNATRLAFFLRSLGFKAVGMHGKMQQSDRVAALSKFKAGTRNILIATDVASRGIDIPSVDCVINYEIPRNSKDYIHRVGRTARAGRSGRALTLVTQYDVELFQRIEALLGKQMEVFPTEEDEVLILQPRVHEATHFAHQEMREKGVDMDGGEGEEEESRGMESVLGKRKGGKGGGGGGGKRSAVKDKRFSKFGKGGGGGGGGKGGKKRH